MKKGWCNIASLAVLGVFIASGLAMGADPPNFTGTWLLVKDKSSNLPSIFAAVDEYILTVKQNGNDSITLSSEIHGRGQTISNEPETFPINGTAVEKEDKRGVKSKRSFKYAEDQRKLVVSTEKQFSGEVQLPNTNEIETWELSDEGKTLTITITPKTEGSQKQVRIFAKKA